jgi:hypothetical protein
MRPSRQTRNATGSSLDDVIQALEEGRSPILLYVDREVPMLSRMFEKRLRGYRAIGYAKGETPLGYGETGDEVVVEYDGDVLRSLKELDDFT